MCVLLSMPIYMPLATPRQQSMPSSTPLRSNHTTLVITPRKENPPPLFVQERATSKRALEDSPNVRYSKRRAKNPRDGDQMEVDDEEYDLFFEVESIIDSKRFARAIKYRVRWKGYDETDDTWEPIDNVKQVMEMIKAFH